MSFLDSAGPNDRRARWRPLLGFLMLTLAVGALGSVATTPNIPTWYAGLAKPDFSPPNWLFAPVWTGLYVLMAVAAWRMWRITGLKSREIVFFFVQLAFNCAWSFIFFAAHQIGAALVEMGILWLLILATAFLFWGKDRPAGLLLLPYLGWVGFAFCLNGAIWQLNT